LNLQVTPAGAVFGGRKMACALGREGIGVKRGEGHWITPVGRFALREVWRRPDQVEVETCLPVREITPDLGWSDDPADPSYNQPVPLPHRFGHEKMWRESGVYDLVAVMDYNLDPIVAGAGSAVFLHVWRGPGQPTAGCVAFAREDLLAILAGWRASSRVEISAQP
jgi:L,D-peptidoglycan transpeptidase YkuD (ErfK/YbiS/YcfS/YnhG family)